MYVLRLDSTPLIDPSDELHFLTTENSVIATTPLRTTEVSWSSPWKDRTSSDAGLSFPMSLLQLLFASKSYRSTTATQSPFGIPKPATGRHA